MNKRQKKSIFLFGAISLLMATLCCAEEPATCPKRNKVFIEARLGDEITINLESNRTTGYQWRFSKPFDKNILLLVGTKYIVGESKLVGAGGKEEWVFKAIKSGKATLYFEYAYPWEKDTQPAKKEAFFIEIKEKSKNVR